MSDTPAETMDPIFLPAEADILIEFRDGQINLTVTAPGGEGLALSRLEMTSLLGLAAMAVGYDAHAQDVALDLEEG